MKATLLTFNAAFLFLCVSMYFGTGWSIALFDLPVVPQLTPANYYMVFVPEVAAATRVFTVMTKLMLVSGFIMIVAEWKTHYRWFPIIVMIAVITSTVLTVYVIFPLNNEMSAGIKEQAELQRVFSSWVPLTKLRVALWSIQWAAMITYFGLKANQVGGGAK